MPWNVVFYKSYMLASSSLNIVVTNNVASTNDAYEQVEPLSAPKGYKG